MVDLTKPPTEQALTEEQLVHKDFDDEQLMEELRSILSIFPPVNFAFAYGSAVFPQAGYDPKQQLMFDFIFAVESPADWHRKNLSNNPQHYSRMMRVIGASGIAQVQEQYGSSIYFNPYIQLPNGRLIKYGVISTKALVDDLTQWKTLYVSGRLHKPVKIIQPDAKIEEANAINLMHALRVAFLQLPETFTEEELFLQIASISYSGDVRMSIAENPNKVKNIVTKNMSHFKTWYQPFLPKFTHCSFDPANRHFKQDVSSSTTKNLIESLPANLLKEMGLLLANSNDNIVEVAPKWERAKTREFVHGGISRIVRKSSFSQSAKGILSAGVLKSTVYLLEKIVKKVRA